VGIMVQTRVTEEAMIAASMSLFISDQGMLNAGISSVVYSNAVGATEGTLNLVNADTITDEKLRTEIKEQEEKNQDALEAASDMVIAEMEKTLERLRDPVKYANGQFTIGGITVDEEDMDAAIDEMVNEFDAVVAKHDLDTEQSATLFALLTAYQNTEDPEMKVQLLEQIKDDVSPDVAMDMARRASDIGEVKASRALSEQDIRAVENAAPTTYEASPFGNTSSPADIFNASAEGGISASINSNDIESPVAKPEPITFET